MKNLPEELKQEIKHNLAALNADLAFLIKPDDGEHPFTETYEFEQFQSLVSAEKTPELLGAFYRSLEILSEGHAGLISADPETIEQAYRTIIESAIQFGEELTNSSDH